MNSTIPIKIDQLKTAISLESIVPILCGEQVDRTRKIHCPLHSDGSPSLHVYDDGHFHCFSCGTHGDVLDFVGIFLYQNRYDPHSHIKDVIDWLGGLHIRAIPATERRPQTVKAQTTLQPEMAERCHNNLEGRTRGWWHSRGLTDDSIDYFKLGHDGRRYTIPVFYRGVLLGIRRRRDDTLENDEHPKYLSEAGSRASLFNADNMLVPLENVIISEGEIDAMLLWQMGFDAVSSTAGAGTFRPEWAAYFSHIRNVFVLYDNDEAGKNGALLVRGFIKRARIISIPQQWKDVGEMCQKYDDPISVLRSITK